MSNQINVVLPSLKGWKSLRGKERAGNDERERKFNANTHPL